MFGHINPKQRVLVILDSHCHFLCYTNSRFFSNPENLHASLSYTSYVYIEAIYISLPVCYYYTVEPIIDHDTLK